jgi:hypothetical protein
MEREKKNDNAVLGQTSSAQLKAVLWKNAVVKARHWKMTMLEICGPLFVLMLLVRLHVQNYNSPAKCHSSSIKLDGDMGGGGERDRDRGRRDRDRE